MLILAPTTDHLYVTLSPGTGPVDVHATWIDTVTATSAITPGRTNTALTTSGQVSVAGTPAAGTFRNVKTLHIRNKSASITPQILIHHNDGVNQELLFDVQLLPGKSIQYTDQGGFEVLT